MQSIQTWKTSRALLTLLTVAALMLALVAQASLSRSAFAQARTIACVELEAVPALGPITVDGQVVTVTAETVITAEVRTAILAGELVDIAVDANNVVTAITIAANCEAQQEELVCVQVTLANLLTGAVTVDGEPLTVDAALLAQLRAGTGALIEAGLIAALTAGEPVNLVVADSVIVDINLGENCIDDGQKGEEPGKTPDNQQEEKQTEAPVETPDNQQEEVDVPSQMPNTGAGGAIPAAGAGIAYLAGVAAMAGSLFTRRKR